MEGDSGNLNGLCAAGGARSRFWMFAIAPDRVND
jgi:hypothetical protein